MFIFKKKEIFYYTSYFYQDKDGKNIGTGHCTIKRKERLQNLHDIKELIRDIEKQSGMTGVIFINLVRL